MADISRAQIRSGNADVERNRHFRLCVVEGRFLDRLAENGGNLTGDAEDALAVRTVCRDGNIEDIVVKAQYRLNVRTRNTIRRLKQTT